MGRTGGMGIAHFRISARGIACALAVVARLAGASSAAADVLRGDVTPNMDCQATTLAPNTCLGNPLDVNAPVGRLGSPESPEDDLEAVFADLGNIDPAAAGADADAAKLRGRALAIIEGDTRPASRDGRLVAGDDDFFARKAYAGLPLLNTHTKVQDVPAGTTTVDVREVRFGDHALLD